MPELTKEVITNEYKHFMFIGLNFPNYTKDRLVELIGYNVSMYPFAEGETEASRKELIEETVTELAGKDGYEFSKTSQES